MSVQLIKVIKKICAEENISFSAFADDYILLLKKNGGKMYVYGNKFANNSASAEQICDDKAGLSELLDANGIPCVKHTFFGRPGANWYFSDPQKDKEKLVSMLKNSRDGLVVKENKGSGGINVFRARTEEELFDAVDRVFAVSPSLAVSPFEHIRHEYRVLMLGNEFRYAFEKIRPCVTGDGKSTVNGLISAKYGEKFTLADKRGDYIPANGEDCMPEWRHNLGQGAVPALVEEAELKNKLASLAQRCMTALTLEFASVDIIDTDTGFKVLEINSGVMIDNFSAYSDEYYRLAESGVKAAILKFFASYNEKNG